MRTFVVAGVALLAVTTRLWVALVWALLTVWAFSRIDDPRRRYAPRNKA